MDWGRFCWVGEVWVRLKRISVFVIQLTLNLEPVYGIIMAVLILDEARHLNFSFYIGTGIILVAVFCYPLLKKRVG